MPSDTFYPLKWLAINFMRSLLSLVLKLGGHPRPPHEPSLKLSYVPTTGRRTRPLALHAYLPDASVAKPTGRLPIHVNVHGSGFCLTGFGADAAFCAWLADSVPCVVVDIDHRKAPEHPWPAGPNDVRDAVRKVREIAEIQGWDANRVSLGGFSSGANLALVEASRHRESGERLICSVVAYYPSTNLAEPAAEKPHLPLGTGAAGTAIPAYIRKLFYSCYLPHTIVNMKDCQTPSDADKPSRSDPRISPLNANPSTFPPATIITASQDSLAREATALVEKLKDSHKDVVQWEAKGQGHGWNLHAKDGTEPGKLKWEAYEVTRDRLRDAYEKLLEPFPRG